MKRTLEEDRWDKELIEEMAGTPDRPNPHAPGNYIPIKINFPKHEPDQKDESEWRKARQEEAPRRTYLKKDDFLVHGYTDGCPQCTYTERNGNAKAGGRHSAACRSRIMDAIKKTELGKKRMAEYEGRLTRAMVEYSHPGPLAENG